MSLNVILYTSPRLMGNYSGRLMGHYSGLFIGNNQIATEM